MDIHNSILNSQRFQLTQMHLNSSTYKLCYNYTVEHYTSNCQHPLDHGKSKRVPENIYFCLINYAKAFDCVDHHKLWKILKQMGIPDLPLEKSIYRSGSNS